MTNEIGDRAQDVGRSHHRRGSIAPETDAILDEYRGAMRAELRETVRELRPLIGQTTLTGEVAKPPLADRLRLWELAIKLARELAAGADVEPSPIADPAPGGRRAARPPKLSTRERRALGG